MAEKVSNIVLIVADALRPDRVGAYSEGNLTQNIDSLARSGEVFDQCYSCINATDPSVTTLLTGQYPTRHGIINHGSNITEEEQSLVSGTTPIPELLEGTHHTVGIDTLERWHQRGFDEYINPRKYGARKPIELLKRVQNKAKSVLGIGSPNGPIRSEKITEMAMGAIHDIDQPFFLFTHYWESHFPYVPVRDHPEKIRNRTYDGEDVLLRELFEPIEGSPWKKRLETRLIGDATTVADVKRKYDAGVWKVDQAVGDLIGGLKKRGIFQNTAIIITADHGESLTEHGIFFDHHGLYDPSIRVPLIINAPGFDGRETQFVQHFDLAPTILELLDVNYKENWFDGVTLVSDGKSRSLDRDAVYVEEGHTGRKRAIRTEAYKFIQRLDDREECRYCGIKHGSDEELFNLKKDPDEERNTINQNPEVAKEFKQRLDSWIRSLPEPSPEGKMFEPSDEVKDHLEEMGYL